MPVVDPSLEHVIQKLRDDLGWRGPGGKPMRYIALPREIAQKILNTLEALSRMGKGLDLDDARQD